MASKQTAAKNAGRRARKRSTRDPRCSPEVLSRLAQEIVDGRLILFAGGGISQNLGLPNFQQLVEHIASEMELEPRAYHVADYPVVAEAYLIRHGQLGGLRSWMDTTWHPAGTDVRQSEIHNLIVKLGFRVIYTTNYDRWLEAAFDAHGVPYEKIANMADLANSRRDATQIIKFHGDFTDDDSLVLTETSYFQRLGFETPLDLRLRADCLARPLLFVGYSLSDMNTRYLLFRLQELWQNSVYAEQRPVSYIFMTRGNAAQEIVLRSRGVEPIVWEGGSAGELTERFLADLLHEVERLRAGRAKPKAAASRRPRAPLPEGS